MKKIILVVLALTLLFAFAPVANAAPAQAGGITVTAQTIDYVSAIAGIAKITNEAHYENERVAVLVSISVPAWYDTSNMGVEIKQEGVAVDAGTAIPVATGNYIIFGTLYSTSGKLKIVIQDYALNAATTAQELWAALYGDRSASAEVSFTPAETYNRTQIPTTQVLEPPKTGDAPTTIIGITMIAAALLCAFIAARRKKATACKM